MEEDSSTGPSFFNFSDSDIAFVPTADDGLPRGTVFRVHQRVCGKSRVLADMLDHVPADPDASQEPIPLDDTARQLHILFTILYLGDPDHNTTDSAWEQEPSIETLLDSLTVCDKYDVPFAIPFLERELISVLKADATAQSDQLIVRVCRYAFDGSSKVLKRECLHHAEKYFLKTLQGAQSPGNLFDETIDAMRVLPAESRAEILEQAYASLFDSYETQCSIAETQDEYMQELSTYLRLPKDGSHGTHVDFQNLHDYWQSTIAGQVVKLAGKPTTFVFDPALHQLAVAIEDMDCVDCRGFLERKHAQLKEMRLLADRLKELRKCAAASTA